MPDELKTRVTIDGADKAQRDLRGVAKGQRGVGKTGEDAGKRVTKGAEDSREAVDQLGSSVGLNTRLFTNWKLGAVAAVVAVVAVFKKAIEQASRFNAEMRQAYQGFVEMSRKPDVGALAQIRGAGEAETATWALDTAKKYGLRRDEPVQAAFMIESGIAAADVGGPEAMDEIEAAAFQTMRAYRASGKTVGGLAIAAQQAGIAKTPADFRRFFAMAGRAAETSAVTLEQLGGIATRLLPAAVNAGIPAEYFLSQAAAMSFRITDPSRLATALEQMIRAAGQASAPLEQFAAESGRKIGELSAMEIMEFQGQALAAAAKRGGPQAVARETEALNLPAEIGTVYSTGFDPIVQAKMRSMRAGIGAAGWPAVAGRFAKVRGTAESQAFAAGQAVTAAGEEAGRAQSLWATLIDLGEAERIRATGAGEDIPGVLEDIFPSQAKRRLAAGGLGRVLYSIFTDPSQAADVRVEAGRQHELVGEARGVYQLTGAAEGTMKSAAQFAQQYHGGTHFHFKDNVDPAGRPVQRMGQ